MQRHYRIDFCIDFGERYVNNLTSNIFKISDNIFNLIPSVPLMLFRSITYICKNSNHGNSKLEF